MQNELARATELPQTQPLAVWRLERTRRTHPLPRELARAAIAHYSDPGDLVLVPKLGGSELLLMAAALGRRAALLPLLKPGGFLALARGTAATDGGRLGEIVRTCQGQGLQYWQHVIALTPEVTAGAATGARAQAASARKRSPDDRRAVRCHHDLLVFRRPAEAIEHTTTAAAAATAA